MMCKANGGEFQSHFANDPCSMCTAGSIQHQHGLRMSSHGQGTQKIVHAAFVTRTHRGFGIAYVHQGPWMTDGKSVPSVAQMDGCKVQDKSIIEHGLHDLLHDRLCLDIQVSCVLGAGRIATTTDGNRSLFFYKIVSSSFLRFRLLSTIL